jgi:Leucine-rich repeat (LRR) protein
LKRLDLRYSSVKDAQLTSWFNLPTLEELFLASCAVSDVAIGHLSDRDVVPNLTVLDLADTNITDVGVSKICKLTKLKRLSLFYCNITDNALKDVAKLENLEVLNLDSRDLSDDGLYHIHNMTKLRELDVYSCRLTDKGCFYISEISSLQSLELCGGGITDLGCSILAGLENLTHLNLSQNERITNRGAAALAVLASLRSLNLSHTRVNSTGLRFFTSLCNLQSLSLFGCAGIDDDANNGIMNLQDNLPKLRCIRSDRTPALDGMFLPDCDDEEFSNDENCVGCEIMWRVESDITHEIAMQGRETDETSEFSDHD